MNEKPVLGYAVVENGEINIRSVGPTWRSAAVNFLFTNRGLDIWSYHDDNEIRASWQNFRGTAELKQVEIKVLV